MATAVHDGDVAVERAHELGPLPVAAVVEDVTGPSRMGRGRREEEDEHERDQAEARHVGGDGRTDGRTDVTDGLGWLSCGWRGLRR